MYLVWRLILLPARFVAKHFRALAAALIGYSLMSLVTTGGMVGSYQVFGAERLLQPESWHAATPWLVAAIFTGSAGAFVGGWVCQLIDRSTKGAMLLAAGLTLIGAVALLHTGDLPPAEVREGLVTQAEMISSVVQPTWLLALRPLSAAVLILMAAQLARRRSEARDYAAA